MIALKSASNASNAVQVESKVLTKKGVIGNAAGHHLSKTSRKLAKYSAAKYLQGNSRLHSDMMSLDTEHCLHTSADSLASDGAVTSGGVQLHRNHLNSNNKHQQLGADQIRPTSPTASFSTSSNQHYQKSRLSISSIARTTTTCLSSSSTQPTSDPLSTTTNCSTITTFGVVLQSPLATNQSSRFLSSCTKSAADTTGYSIITEEGSSSSSGALPPPLNGASVALGCLEGELEPDVNEHSPLPVVNSSICDKNTTNDLLHSANGSPLSLHHQTFSESPCRCDHSYQLDNEESVQHYHPSAASKRHSLAQQHQGNEGRGWPLSWPSRAKSLSMSIPNDANQRTFVCGRVGALFDRYRAQSSEDRGEAAPSLPPSVLSALSDDDDVGESAIDTATTTRTLDSANRVNNDAGPAPSTAFPQNTAYSLARNDCVVDFHHPLPSDSNLIAIDTNYCLNQGNNPAEILVLNGASEVAKKCTTDLCNNDSFVSSPSQNVICPADDHASTVVEVTSMMHQCNNSANGSLSQQQHITSTLTSPLAAFSVVNIGTTPHLTSSMATPTTTIITTSKELPASISKQLKENSTSSSGSTAQPNNHQSNHREKGSSKKKGPHKQSSEHSNPSPSPHQSRLYQKESIESKRERKAAKTLAIITGTFPRCVLHSVFLLSQTHAYFNQ